mmetsp:Transcript_28927/g.55391  ORF Transcript_28927/g.55391 Transcript_28927/m.55391 type:complete len:223 (+) Transcript_28927:2226-2894(+)
MVHEDARREERNHRAVVDKNHHGCKEAKGGNGGQVAAGVGEEADHCGEGGAKHGLARAFPRVLEALGDVRLTLLKQPVVVKHKDVVHAHTHDDEHGDEVEGPKVRLLADDAVKEQRRKETKQDLQHASCGQKHGVEHVDEVHPHKHHRQHQVGETLHEDDGNLRFQHLELGVPPVDVHVSGVQRTQLGIKLVVQPLPNLCVLVGRAVLVVCVAVNGHAQVEH